jgi:hypothetical protein
VVSVEPNTEEKKGLPKLAPLVESGVAFATEPDVILVAALPDERPGAAVSPEPETSSSSFTLMLDGVVSPS